MSLINKKILKNNIKRTFSCLSVGDEIYKYVFDDLEKDYSYYTIIGDVYKIDSNDFDGNEYLIIYYTYNGVIKSRMYAYPSDYYVINNIDRSQFIIFSPYKMTTNELNDCVKNKSNLDFLSKRQNLHI